MFEKNILQQLKSHKNIIIVLAQESSYDDIASALFFDNFLRLYRIRTKIIFPASLPSHISFFQTQTPVFKHYQSQGELVISLPIGGEVIKNIHYQKHTDKVDITIHQYEDILSPDTINIQKTDESLDAIMFFGFSDIQECSDQQPVLTKIAQKKKWYQISAKKNQQPFADINLYDAESQSTSEVILKKLIIPHQLTNTLTSQMSTLLMAGILSKNESFLFQPTAQSFHFVGLLQSCGADQPLVIEELFKKKSYITLQLWGTILRSLRFNPAENIALSYISDNDFRQYGGELVDIQNIANDLLNTVSSAPFSVLFAEKSEDIIVQIRTQQADVDFTVLDKQFQTKSVKYGRDIIFHKKQIYQIERDIIELLESLIPLASSEDIPSVADRKETINLPHLSINNPDSVPFSVISKE